MASGWSLSADTTVSGNISTSTTWTLAGSPYIVTGAVSVSGANSPVLTIEPGVVVKFNGGQGLWIGNGGPGGVSAVGTAAQPIRFTTTQGTVSEGLWRGIFLGEQSLPGSRIANAVVEGAGSAYEGGVIVDGGSPTLDTVTAQKNRAAGVRVNGGSPTISSCTVTLGSQRGIWLLGGNGARVYGNVVTANAWAGIQNESSSASIRFNTVSGNGTDGILDVSGALKVRDNTVAGNATPSRNTDSANRTLDARQQWWGSPEPPTGFVGRVEYDPWLGSPPTPLFAIGAFTRSTSSFNPEGASVRFSFSFPSAASWTFTVTDTGGTDVRTFSGSGDAGSVVWDGTDGAGTAPADGSYTYRLDAVETATSTPSAPLLGRVTLDRTIPIADIATPGEGNEVSAPITVGGTAAGTGFTGYLLQYGSGEFPPTLTTSDQGSVAVTAGTLGLWSAVLTEPVYTVRLTVNASGGKSAVQSLTVRPSGQSVCP